MSGPALGSAEVTTLVSKALSSRIAHVEYLGLGLGNENWLIRDASGRRFNAKFAPLSLEEKRRSSAMAARLASDCGVPTPRLVYLARATDRFLRVFEWVDGFAAKSVLSDPGKQHRLFNDLGQAVARLHGLEQTTFSSRLDGASPTFARWTEYVEYRLRQIRQRCERYGGLSRGQFEEVFARTSLLSREISPLARPTLCHRDLHIDNLVVDREGHLAAVLDFDMAELWDTAGEWFKLEWFLFPLVRGGKEIFEGAYRALRPSLPAWEDRKKVVDLLETANTLPNAVAEGWDEFGADARARLEQLLSG